MALHTEELVDAFGNTLADGTIAQFVHEGPSGRGAVSGTVQNGAVHIELSAPTSPGRLTGHLVIHGVESNDVTIDYASAISGFDVRIEVIGDEFVLRVDNAFDPSGSFLADGVLVTWGNQRASLGRGSAQIRLPAALADVDAYVEILGYSAKPSQGTP